MINKIKYIIVFISVLYAHDAPFTYELGLSANYPQKEFNEYARLGTGLQFNLGAQSLFKKNENISIISSAQFSRFGSKKWETLLDDDVVSMRSTEKLLSLSIGPRFTFKEQFYVGFALSQNLFYNRVTSQGTWIDTGIGECDYEDTFYGCEEEPLLGLFWDLGLTLVAESIKFIGSEITGIFSSKNLYSGYKINAGILMGKAIFELSYHTMPTLKYPILTNDETDLLDYIDADYLSVNISFPLNRK